MSVLWVEDNFPTIADIVDNLEEGLNLAVRRECHVSDAFELLHAGEKFSVVIIDVMLPLGGLSVPNELLEFRSNYDMAKDSEFSGLLLAEYLIRKNPNLPIVILSDFCDLATNLDKEFENVHLFFKQAIDDEFPRLMTMIADWVAKDSKAIENETPISGTKI